VIGLQGNLLLQEHLAYCQGILFLHDIFNLTNISMFNM
jgi:hypothetical protein